ncbi:MAG: MmgE/PrpD family protein [Solirubrobacteraceae bacterium]
MQTATSRPTRVQELACFVCATRYEQLSPAAAEQLKLRVLDALGCAFGALDGGPPERIAEYVRELGGAPLATLIGGGGKRSAPDRAALRNGALVRYLDFNDSYLAPGETCHPSDNLAPVLAAAEYAHADGRTLLSALATAYQVQNRLSEVAPVRAKGFDHTTQGAYGAAAGAARALRLDQHQTANAIAIAGTTQNALRVTRTGALSNWKGLAYPFTASAAVQAALLAKLGITGPREVFEGNKGFIETISGPFEIDWAAEDLESVTRTILKRFNAEIHSQSAIEALLELRAQNNLSPDQVSRIELETFQVAYDIIGGGEEGSKFEIATKEEADHSLPYLLAVAMLDGQVLPEQYQPQRIVSADVQDLLHRVTVTPAADLSGRFPAQHSARVRIHLHDGRVLEREQFDYEGFHTRPMSWQKVAAKFDRLAQAHLDDQRRAAIKTAVGDLDQITVADLTTLLT